MSVISKVYIKYGLILMLILSLLIVLVAVEKGYFSPFFKQIGVYPEKEQYTVLFFKNSEMLANDAALPGISNFTFGVKNEEGSAIEYPYVVEVMVGDVRTTIDSGLISAQTGETTYKTVQIDEKKYVAGSIVSVSLPLHNKTINFSI